MKYQVGLSYIVEQSAVIEVEADSEEEAIQKADEIAPIHCEEVTRSLEFSEAEQITD